MRSFPRVFVAAACAVALAGCSSERPAPSAAPEAPPPSPSATPTPTPPPVHPFTGARTAKRDRVLAIKIDNTHAAHPQYGLRQADIVYVEQVEGGLTRLMAVFSSKLPRKVGPVRSARISDLHLLHQFRRPAFAFSGAQSRLLPRIADAPLVDVNHGRQPGSYFRDGGRPAPYNLFLNPRSLVKRAGRAGKASDIGFRFGEAPEGGKKVRRWTARWPSARMEFRWSAAQKRWLVWQDGSPDRAAEGGQLGGRTVVIQYAKTMRSQYHDFLGNYTPYIRTVGTGRAVVLRDGRAYQARWSRAKESWGTRFTTPDGKRIAFAPGQVWVVLVNDGKPRTP